MLDINSKKYLLSSIFFKLGVLLIICLYLKNIYNFTIILPIILIIYGLIGASKIDLYINYGGIEKLLAYHRIDLSIKLISIISLDVFLAKNAIFLIFFNIIILLINMVVEYIIILKIKENKINNSKIDKLITENFEEKKIELLKNFLLYIILISTGLALFKNNYMITIIVFVIINTYFCKKSMSIINRIQKNNKYKFIFIWIISSILGIVSYFYISDNIVYLFLANNYVVTRDAMYNTKTSLYKFNK